MQSRPIQCAWWAPTKNKAEAGINYMIEIIVSLSELSTNSSLRLFERVIQALASEKTKPSIHSLHYLTKMIQGWSDIVLSTIPGCMKLVAQSYLNLCHPMDYSPPGFFVHRVLQARLLEWVAMPSSRVSSWCRDQTWVSCIAGRFFTRSYQESPCITLRVR